MEQKIQTHFGEIVLKKKRGEMTSTQIKQYNYGQSAIKKFGDLNTRAKFICTCNCCNNTIESRIPEVIEMFIYYHQGHKTWITTIR